jgi:molybdopterin-containing oxidoreductase family membrane subunit
MDSTLVIPDPKQPILDEPKSLGQITDDILSPLEAKPTRMWWVAFLISSAVMTLMPLCFGYEVAVGIGTLGDNKTVGWGFYIINFVFWVGIGHAGTLISAILYLLRQKWRTTIARSSEAMTLFAVMCAGMFPALHTGRPWFDYWMFPYPNMQGMLWPNFRSPLLWDMFAINTYFTISVVFWYTGLIPDLASMRERANGLRKKVLSIFSFGWDGSAKSWHHYELVYLILAGIATPLVLSVHSVVSFDFATSLLPGWHSTILPPYFVAGAILSGFAMVLTLLVIARTTMKLEAYITMRHIEAMCKVELLTGMLVGLSYSLELFTAWYSGNQFEAFLVNNRTMGPYWWSFWIMVSCNVLVPQLYWFKKMRTNLVVVFIASLLVNVGMWFERYVIIVTSLHRDFLPSSWRMYWPTVIEWGVMIGMFGFFFTAFLVFCRFLPVIAAAEVKAEVGVANSKKH